MNDDNVIKIYNKYINEARFNFIKQFVDSIFNKKIEEVKKVISKSDNISLSLDEVQTTIIKPYHASLTSKLEKCEEALKKLIIALKIFGLSDIGLEELESELKSKFIFENPDPFEFKHKSKSDKKLPYSTLMAHLSYVITGRSLSAVFNEYDQLIENSIRTIKYIRPEYEGNEDGKTIEIDYNKYSGLTEEQINKYVNNIFDPTVVVEDEITKKMKAVHDSSRIKNNNNQFFMKYKAEAINKIINGMFFIAERNNYTTSNPDNFYTMTQNNNAMFMFQHPSVISILMRMMLSDTIDLRNLNIKFSERDVIEKRRELADQASDMVYNMMGGRRGYQSDHRSDHRSDHKSDHRGKWSKYDKRGKRDQHGKHGKHDKHNRSKSKQNMINEYYNNVYLKYDIDESNLSNVKKTKSLYELIKTDINDSTNIYNKFFPLPQRDQQKNHKKQYKNPQGRRQWQHGGDNRDNECIYNFEGSKCKIGERNEFISLLNRSKIEREQRYENTDLTILIGDEYNQIQQNIIIYMICLYYETSLKIKTITSSLKSSYAELLKKQNQNNETKIKNLNFFSDIIPVDEQSFNNNTDLNRRYEEKITDPESESYKIITLLNKMLSRTTDDTKLKQLFQLKSKVEKLTKDLVRKEMRNRTSSTNMNNTTNTNK